VILVYGFVSTFGSEIGGDKIGEIVDKTFDVGKWFLLLIFVAGGVVGWQQTMLLGAWSVILFCIKYFITLRKFLTA